jgi:magnesium-transporting ATPase (P-type)
VEAIAEMAAFFAVFLAAGWRPGESFPDSALAAASGAAFATVVLAQTANAFACRSTTRPAWQLPWMGNKLLIGAVATALFIAAGFLFIPAVAELLGQEPPPGVGWAIALASIPLLIAVDAVHKWLRRARDPKAVSLR